MDLDTHDNPREKKAQSSFRCENVCISKTKKWLLDFGISGLRISGWKM